MSGTRVRIAAALALFVMGAGTLARGASAAGEPQVLVALAKWQMRGDHLTIVIPLADALTAKQKDMINGGFTTVSQLSLRLPSASGSDKDDDDKTAAFYGVRCSVKFDAWEETYDVARLDDRPRTALVKEYAEYGDLCLKAELDRPSFDAIVQRLAPGGGTIMARLVVKQTSVEEADRIKEWLIQQQSGVMQGLFSHMLGELSLNQTLRVKVSVPPKPAAVEREPNVKQNGDQIDPKRKG